MLLRDGPAKPSARAVASRSSGSVVPASAPEPSGERARRRLEVAEALRVAPEHLDEREPVVGEPHRLRALEVGVAGQHRVEVLARAREQHLLQLVQARARGARGVAQVEREVGRDLVVAAAPGVQPRRGGADAVAQPRLHVHVDVFERRRRTETAPTRSRRRSRRARAAARRARPRRSAPRCTSISAWALGEPQVVARERAVEVDRRREALDGRVGVLAGSGPPRVCCVPASWTQSR